MIEPVPLIDVIVEEGAVGGFGAAIMHHLALRGLLDGGLRLRSMTLPDRFIDHGTPSGQIVEAGLSAKDIVATALSALGHEQPSPVAVGAQ